MSLKQDAAAYEEMAALIKSKNAALAALHGELSKIGQRITKALNGHGQPKPTVKPKSTKATRARKDLAMAAAYSKTPASKPLKKASPGRVLQGQYVGYLRTLTGKKRARAEKLARTQGKRAAVRLMKQWRAAE